MKELILVAALATAIGSSEQVQTQPAPAVSVDRHYSGTLVYRDGPSANSKCALVAQSKPLQDVLVLSPQAIGTFCAAPASSTPPVIAAFGDATYYVLATDLIYKLGSKRDTVVVPRGFITDLASIPRPLWSMLPRDGQYMSAAILHDYMYWDQRCTKDEADTILKLQMTEFGVPLKTVQAVYNGVRAFGSSAWAANSKSRRISLRVVPERYLKEFLASDLNSQQTWRQLEWQMLANGVRPAVDTGNPKVTDICRSVVGL
jgi:hypothetical protein